MDKTCGTEEGHGEGTVLLSVDEDLNPRYEGQCAEELRLYLEWCIEVLLDVSI